MRIEGFYFLWEEVRISAEKRGESKGCRFNNSREGEKGVDYRNIERWLGHVIEDISEVVGDNESICLLCSFLTVLAVLVYAYKKHIVK